MPDATILNGVTANRIFKSNASATYDEAKAMLDHYRDQLMILAAMAPMAVDDGDGPVSWPFYVRREVDGIIEGMRGNWWKEFAARYIMDWPDDCEDPFEQD